jgi:hypothetical protein
VKLLNGPELQVLSHVTTTDDDFILKLFRVIPSHADPLDYSRPSILIQHGMFASAETWVD